MKALVLSATGGIVGENNFAWAKAQGIQLTRNSYKEGAVPLAVSHELYLEQLEGKQFPAFCEIEIAVKNAKGANGKPIGSGTLDEITYLKPLELNELLGLFQSREDFVIQSGASRPQQQTEEEKTMGEPAKPAVAADGAKPAEAAGSTFFGGRK